jgi:hypothetical protein
MISPTLYFSYYSQLNLAAVPPEIYSAHCDLNKRWYVYFLFQNPNIKNPIIL